MTDVYSNIQNGKYENTAKYPTGSSKDPVIAKERESYIIEQGRIEKEFYEDICDELGIDPNMPSSEKIFWKAYMDGHAYGYTEVYNHMVDLNDFVNEWAALKVIESRD